MTNSRSKPDRPSAPSDLSAKAKQLWRRILKEWAIDDAASLEILAVGLQALTRAEKCRKQIDAMGELVVDRFDQQKVNPLLSAERDARGQFLQAIGKLNLDLEPLRDGRGRPPGG